jgi:hypothetical protein
MNMRITHMIMQTVSCIRFPINLDKIYIIRNERSYDYLFLCQQILNLIKHDIRGNHYE